MQSSPSQMFKGSPLCLQPLCFIEELLQKCSQIQKSAKVKFTKGRCFYETSCFAKIYVREKLPIQIIHLHSSYKNSLQYYLRNLFFKQQVSRKYWLGQKPIFAKFFQNIFPEITEITNQCQNNRKDVSSNQNIVGPDIFFEAYAQCQGLSEKSIQILCKSFAKFSSRKAFFLKCDSVDFAQNASQHFKWKSIYFTINIDDLSCQIHRLREKCPNTQFFLVRIFPYSVRMRENTDSVFGHFSRSDLLQGSVALNNLASQYFVKCLLLFYKINFSTTA